MLKTILIPATPTSPDIFSSTEFRKNVVIPADASVTISDEPFTKQCPMNLQSFFSLTNLSFVSAITKYRCV